MDSSRSAGVVVRTEGRWAEETAWGAESWPHHSVLVGTVKSWSGIIPISQYTTRPRERRDVEDESDQGQQSAPWLVTEAHCRSHQQGNQQLQRGAPHHPVITMVSKGRVQEVTNPGNSSWLAFCGLGETVHRSNYSEARHSSGFRATQDDHAAGADITVGCCPQEEADQVWRPHHQLPEPETNLKGMPTDVGFAGQSLSIALSMLAITG